MNVGFVGLGKLGLPVATCMAARGLHVYGYDPKVSRYPDDLSYETGFADVARTAKNRVRFCKSIADVVRETDVIFVAVQTPHEPRFEGITPLPDDRADFDYSTLRVAAAGIAGAAATLNKRVTVAVISTVLPGTMERHVVPLLGSYCKLAYVPSFIAMGTTIRDFLEPEFLLIGGDEDRALDPIYQKIYVSNVKPKRARVTVQAAELTKVAYNTFIGLKIAFANTLMEVCHKTGTDVDEVTGSLKLAHRRLISGAYLDGGMGDGGGCHPRDNIALSWLARELDLSYDLFGAAMEAREAQADWLCDLMLAEGDLPLAILGYAYKPSSHLYTGSPALLVANLLEQRGEDVKLWDQHVGLEPDVFQVPHVYLIGCRHPELPDLKLPRGSVVIDPFRYFPDQEGVKVVRLGAVANDRAAGTRREVHQAAA